jgi:hypothetical protein
MMVAVRSRLDGHSADSDRELRVTRTGRLYNRFQRQRHVEGRVPRSAGERREDDREDGASAASLVNQIAAMLAHDCLLYERVAHAN